MQSFGMLNRSSADKYLGAVGLEFNSSGTEKGNLALLSGDSSILAGDNTEQGTPFALSRTAFLSVLLGCLGLPQDFP